MYRRRCDRIAKISMTSPIVINMQTREPLAGETKGFRPIFPTQNPPFSSLGHSLAGRGCRCPISSKRERENGENNVLVTILEDKNKRSLLEIFCWCCSLWGGDVTVWTFTSKRRYLTAAHCTCARRCMPIRTLFSFPAAAVPLVSTNNHNLVLTKRSVADNYFWEGVSWRCGGRGKLNNFPKNIMVRLLADMRFQNLFRGRDMSCKVLL